MDAAQRARATKHGTVARCGVCGEEDARFVFGGGQRVPRRLFSFSPLTRAAFDAPPPDGVRATWLGHSTVLVELEGKRFLCDPVWADRGGPVRGAGPRRFFPNPLPLAELPRLDAVLYSHDHYDHLDRATALRMAELGVLLVTPRGVGEFLVRWGVPAHLVRELDWGDELALGEGAVRLVCPPARHFSGRGLFDRNRTRWCSRAILGRARRAYFGGDGGPGRHFAELGAAHGPFVRVEEPSALCRLEDGDPLDLQGCRHELNPFETRGAGREHVRPADGRLQGDGAHDSPQERANGDEDADEHDGAERDERAQESAGRVSPLGHRGHERHARHRQRHREGCAVDQRPSGPVAREREARRRDGQRSGPFEAARRRPRSAARGDEVAAKGGQLTLGTLVGFAFAQSS